VIQRFFFNDISVVGIPANSFEIEHIIQTVEVETVINEFEIFVENDTSIEIEHIIQTVEVETIINEFEIFVENDMGTEIKYKGSFSPIIANTDSIQILRIKYDGTYIDFSQGTQTVKLYLLTNYTDAVASAILTFTGVLTTPVGKTGNGYVTFNFPMGTVTAAKRGIYYYLLYWNTGTLNIQISKPKDTIEII
jgi:hypothetical protein